MILKGSCSFFDVVIGGGEQNIYLLCHLDHKSDIFYMDNFSSSVEHGVGLGLWQ